MALTTSSLDALVALQRALTPDDLWQATNQLLRSTLPVFHTLIGLPCVGTLPVFLRTTLPVSDTEDYFLRLDAVAPMEPMLARNPGAPVVRLSDQLPTALLPGLPFYEQFMKPYGWLYSAAMLFWTESGNFIGQLSLVRTAEQGDISDEEMQLLRLLHAHVNAAVNRLLAAERRAAAHRSLEHTMKTLPLSIASLDWDLTINYINRSARDDLAAWRLGAPEARARKNNQAPQLPPDLKSAARALKVDWEEALHAGAQAQPQLLRTIEHPEEAGFRSTLRLVEPVAGRSLQPSFILEFFRPPLEQHDPASAMAALAKLTATEREVGKLAAAGLKNPEIMRKLGVSESTVRTHLRNIFTKLGISSRGKLAPLYQALSSSRLASR